MAVVLLLLKAIGWLLLAVLALLAVVLLLPVTLELDYAQGQFTAKLKLLGLRFALYPRPPKKEKPVRPAKKRPRPPKADRQKQPQPNPLPGQGLSSQPGGQQPAPPPPKEPSPVQSPGAPASQQHQTASPLGGQADQQKKAGQDTGQNTAKQKQKPAAAPQSQPQESWVMRWLADGRLQSLIQTAGGAVRRLLWGLRIHHIRIAVPVHRRDAAATALGVGWARAALHSSLGILNNFFRLQFKQLDIWPDYTGEDAGREVFSCKVTGQLIIMVNIAIWALVQLKRQKVW